MYVWAIATPLYDSKGNIVGAVGVSGAATGEQDEACAREGLKAIAFDLEMAGP